MIGNKEKWRLMFLYSCSVHFNQIQLQVMSTLHFKGAKRFILKKGVN